MTDLADRYGTRERPRWFWWAIAALGIAVGTAWAAWIALDTEPFQSEVHSYDVVSDTRIDVTLEISREDPVAMTCSVYAQALDHSIVGERTVEVPESTEDPVRVTVDITTTDRAVTGVIRSCEVTD